MSILTLRLVQHKDKLKLRKENKKRLSRRDLKKILKTKEDLTIQIYHPKEYNAKQLNYFVEESIGLAGKYAIIRGVFSAISSPASYFLGFEVYDIARNKCFDDHGWTDLAVKLGTCDYIERADFSNLYADIGMVLLASVIPLGLYAISEFALRSLPYIKLAHKFNEGDEFVINGKNVNVEWIPEEQQYLDLPEQNIETHVEQYQYQEPQSQDYQTQNISNTYTQGTQNSYPQSTDLEDKIAQLRSEIQDLESN